MPQGVPKLGLSHSPSLPNEPCSNDTSFFRSSALPLNSVVIPLTLPGWLIKSIHKACKDTFAYYTSACKSAFSTTPNTLCPTLGSLTYKVLLSNTTNSIIQHYLGSLEQFKFCPAPMAKLN